MAMETVARVSNLRKTNQIMPNEQAHSKKTHHQKKDKKKLGRATLAQTCESTK